MGNWLHLLKMQNEIGLLVIEFGSLEAISQLMMSGPFAAKQRYVTHCMCNYTLLK